MTTPTHHLSSVNLLTDGSGRAGVLFDLRDLANEGKFASWRLEYAAELVRRIRDAVVERLAKALPEHRKNDIDNALVGRPVNGRAIPPEQRVRIIPLPSIGHEHVDRSIRRILVDIPAGCPVNLEDICWAFSSLSLLNPETGEEFAMLQAAENSEMLAHYGIEGHSSRRWRTVTPMVLGEQYGVCGAIPEKLDVAIADVLRHEGVGVRPVSVFAQKTPFEKNGERAESFAVENDQRFTKEKLWHVDVTLDRVVRGPLLLGDGRYFGLGLLAPVRENEGLLCYQVMHGLAEQFVLTNVARALRRAVMARCGERNGGKLDAYVHGHDGREKAQNTPHLYFQYDPESRHLWILAPHVVDRREPSKNELWQWKQVVKAMEGFAHLRAGDAGALDVRLKSVDGDEPILSPSRIWETISAYYVNRHRDVGDVRAAVREDVRQSLANGGWPEAEIEVELCTANSEGVGGMVQLKFPVAIAGPIVLGRTRYVGGGLFRGKLSD